MSQGSWEYRVVRHMPKDGPPWYEIHEVHYAPDGECYAISKAASTICGDSVKELREIRNMMLHALLLPVLDYETREVVEPASLKSGVRR